MSETISCPACGSANEADRKFCGECGTALAQTCPSCGTPNAPSVKFCGECGTALTASTAPTAPPQPQAAPTAERRLVSVLFADLVGFTAASEQRDAEDTRELLSRYFDASRRLIELYGGTVEKFIGDAVMAVWGTPTATEDDAERAVRAALDLVAAVSALGDEVGAPELAARAGVLTGEAAVTLGAEGQGMVAGDLVNTASRIQSLAEPGSVLRRGRDTARHGPDDRVLRRRGPRGQGEGRPRRALAGAASCLRRPGCAQVIGPRGAVCRARPRAAANQRPLPHMRRRAKAAADLYHRYRRHRQVAPGLGVLQVLRRPPSDHVLAPGALSLVRRRRHVLGARGHGSDACAHHGG